MTLKIDSHASVEMNVADMQQFLATHRLIVAEWHETLSGGMLFSVSGFLDNDSRDAWLFTIDDKAKMQEVITLLKEAQGL